jgi:hypothetical protein
MGYLNNSVVTVDAILTTKGRELLAQGNFNITQFALADDEIDYTLYNPTHPSGSAFYGEAIQNMPLLEAFPQETQAMKYKLTTLPRGTAKMPILETISVVNIRQGQSQVIDPETANYFSRKESSGYTFTIADVRLMSTFEGVGINTDQATALNQTTTVGTNVSKTVIGTTLSLRGTTVNTLFGTTTTTLYTTLTIVGRDSGARVTIPVQVNKVS